MNYREKIEHSHVYAVAKKTPLEFQTNLSARIQNRVLLKREDMQPVFSFKLRGAYNKMASLSQDATTRRDCSLCWQSCTRRST
jgi:threonine dehydratase